MARLPGCLKLTGMAVEDGELVAYMQVRKWHPQYWWIWLRALWLAAQRMWNERSVWLEL